MRPDELEHRLRERLDALGPAPRAELLHVLMLPDFDRADRIGSFWGNPATRSPQSPVGGCYSPFRPRSPGVPWRWEARRRGEHPTA
jgi:hypothetical protein